jgi:hypothetical protein
MERGIIMPCDTRLKPKQTIQQRAAEVRAAVDKLALKLLKKQVRPIVDRATGAITFAGWSEQDRDGITDACAYRRLKAQTTNSLVLAEIARAEALAGRPVNTKALAQGVHSHDGGVSWHHGH